MYGAVSVQSLRSNYGAVTIHFGGPIWFIQWDPGSKLGPGSVFVQLFFSQWNFQLVTGVVLAVSPGSMSSHRSKQLVSPLILPTRGRNFLSLWWFYWNFFLWFGWFELMVLGQFWELFLRICITGIGSFISILFSAFYLSSLNLQHCLASVSDLFFLSSGLILRRSDSRTSLFPRGRDVMSLAK
jgi:hypothetical protein